MDLAYDHIAEEALPKENNQGESSKQPETQGSLNQDIQDAYKAFSNSPWGSWLGGQVGSVVKQGQSVYKEAQQEVTSLGEDASKSFATLRARALSLRTAVPTIAEQSGSSSDSKDKENETTPTTAKAAGSAEFPNWDKIKTQAAKRLKDIQKAEDAADKALLEFGGKAYDFLKTAIAVNPDESASTSTSRFETKDESGKRVFHTSRFDAQLHVIHTTEKSFTEDPASDEFGTWVKDFDVEKKTDNISGDLNKYPELRATMEKLVPDTVPYAEFWKRYYYLRHSIETAEARRRDLLKAASAEEEIGWGEESDDEAAPAKPAEKAAEPAKEKSVKQPVETPARPASTESSSTIQPPANKTLLKPSEPRKSNDEKSQADSDTSYDLVGAQSGNPSQAPSSPKESRKADDDSDDEEDSDEEDSDEEEDSDDEEWE